MSKEIQSKLRELLELQHLHERLKEMLIEDGYNNSNIVMQTLTEIIKKQQNIKPR